MGFYALKGERSYFVNEDGIWDSEHKKVKICDTEFELDIMEAENPAIIATSQDVPEEVIHDLPMKKRKKGLI